MRSGRGRCGPNRLLGHWRWRWPGPGGRPESMHERRQKGLQSPGFAVFEVGSRILPLRIREHIIVTKPISRPVWCLPGNRGRQVAFSYAALQETPVAFLDSVPAKSKFLSAFSQTHWTTESLALALIGCAMGLWVLFVSVIRIL